MVLGAHKDLVIFDEIQTKLEPFNVLWVLSNRPTERTSHIRTPTILLRSLLEPSPGTSALGQFNYCKSVDAPDVSQEKAGLHSDSA
jgi:hypothetical protein